MNTERIPLKIGVKVKTPESSSLEVTPVEQEALKTTNELTYEEEREKLKYGHFTSILLFWASFDAIVAFTSHYPLSKVGITAGLVINFVITGLTIYGVQILNFISNNLEEDPFNQQRVSSIQSKLKDNC